MITLATLPQATKQEVFDQAALHLLTQNKASLRELKDGEDPLDANLCAYRGKDETKCAAGCFLSDEEYSPGFENKSWSTLVEEGKAPKEHQILIQRLQRTHDTSTPVYWPSRLVKLAEDHGLNPDVVFNFKKGASVSADN